MGVLRGLSEKKARPASVDEKRLTEQKGCIVGFSFKGLNGVFKLSDGVHAHINSNNSIEYTPGLCRFIHQHVRRGGFKTKQWVDQQSDLRWKELYDTQF